MSPPGATKPVDTGAPAPLSRERNDPYFLPNFCEPRMVLAVVLIAELLALTFSLVRPGAGLLTELARISVLMQWLGLTSAALICGLRRPLRHTPASLQSSAVLAIVLANILLLSILILALGRWFDGAGSLGVFPERLWPFAARNLGIGLIVTSLLLRYFFVSHEWRQHIESEARTRIDALQARIRPHFLFNTMNTIAALTRTDPGLAEEAVEDLADLFRASLGDAGRFSSLSDEIELARIYARIEQLRLGERLRIDWALDALPPEAELPTLTLQPLLENAILHGIEQLEQGGTVAISGRLYDDMLEIRIGNPVAPGADQGPHQGSGIATVNIRERLALAYGGRAQLAISQTDARYEACLRVPLHSEEH